MRNKDPRDLRHLKDAEKELRKGLSKHGFDFVYPEDLFYRTHKISRKDFLAQLDASQDP